MSRSFKVDIWHNILWSRYKAAVFTALSHQAKAADINVTIYHIAETEGRRKSLSGVDHSCHAYPYHLLFKGAYQDVSLLTRMRKIAALTWASKADIFVLTGFEKPEIWLQMLLVKIKRKKFILFCDSTLHDNTSNALKTLIKRAIFKFADGVFGYGERAKDYALSLGIKPSQWHQRVQAASLPEAYNTALILNSRAALKASDIPLTFLYVGRISPEKNLSRLIEAFSFIVQDMPQAHLNIIGGGSKEERLKQQVNALNLSNHIHFLDSQSGDKLSQSYMSAHFFILPSISEPWGLVVNEALHYGCPVLVSKTCGCVPELVIEGETGFRLNPYKAEDIAQIMMKATKHFTNFEATAQNCLNHIEPYNPDNAATQMIDGLQHFIDAK
jgi:glycosyltransferase involved in cell wall biosynthesis